MMDQNNHDTGGPAFPVEVRKDLPPTRHPHPGMTLLDYFAGQALIGLISLPGGGHNLPAMQAELSKSAYGYARAMLQARKAGG